jgi:hypothetical protein
MTETPQTLKKNGGVDLTKLQMGVKLLVETTAGIYEMTVVNPATGGVSVKATVPPFTAQTPFHTRLERSIWDDKGSVFIPFWIGKGMRMVFVDSFGKLFASHSVMSAKVESGDGSWTYEVWETNPTKDA